ncbi:MAG: tetratricopeptide repeat protein [Gemmatimonadota bacterium]|nr:tetratricopeptide repeat protein [Gemmatimonadota bacterium]
MTTTRLTAPAPVYRPGAALPDLLADAREHELRGRLVEATAGYRAVIDAADARADARLLAEALRRLGNIHRRRHELDVATDLAQRSFEVSLGANDPSLVGEAVNALAMIHFVRGDWERARQELRRALAVAGDNDAALRARVEQNLGTMANVEGDLDAALAHYERSLEAFRAAGDRRGLAIAYHNIGMNKADRELWRDADVSFRASLEIAESIGDVNLRGLVLLNRTEVHIARQQFDAGKHSAEEALRIFDGLGARELKAEAYKCLGVLYRETGRPQLAEARLKTALDLSGEIGAVAVQAEATRELAVLYGQMGRNQETLKLLNSAHRLFGRLNARRDLVDVAAKTSQLEGIYLEVVRQWGSSLESSDTYTFGHSSRVAEYAVAVAAAFGLADSELTAVRVGAYLHDIGKIRVPHEILNKSEKLTAAEFDVIKQHPLYGVELLAPIDFPWDVKPIVRSHHEKIDGTGYPDGLRGDEIPLSAQIIGIADVYDALTTARSYRAALPRDRALAELRRCRHWWWPEVYEAFMRSVGAEGS